MTVSEISVIAWVSGRKRKVTIKVGEQYIIDPLNPTITANRGRQVTVLSLWRDVRDGSEAIVRYVDTNKQAILTDVVDLVPL